MHKLKPKLDEVELKTVNGVDFIVPKKHLFMVAKYEWVAFENDIWTIAKFVSCKYAFPYKLINLIGISELEKCDVLANFEVVEYSDEAFARALALRKDLKLCCEDIMAMYYRYTDGTFGSKKK